MSRTLYANLKNDGKILYPVGLFLTGVASFTISRHDFETGDTMNTRNEWIKLSFINQYKYRFQHRIFGSNNMLLFSKQRSQCESSATSMNLVNQTIYDNRNLTEEQNLSPLSSSSSSTWHYVKMSIPNRFKADHAIFGTLMKGGNIESYTVYKRVPNLSFEMGPHESKSIPHGFNGVTTTYLDDFTSSYIVENGVRCPTSFNSLKTSSLNDKNTKVKMEYNDENELITVTMKVGPKMNGHANIIHGGIISLLFDDTMGFAYEAMATAPTKINNGICKTELSTKNSNAYTASLKVDFRSPLWQKHVENDKIIIRIYHDRTEGRKIYLKGQMTNMDGSIVYAEASSLYIWEKPKK